MNHPSNLGSIRQSKGLIESLEPKASDRLSLVVRSSDHAPDPFDFNRMLNPFHHETFWFSGAFSRLFSETSSGLFSWLMP
jgi:hypothetical protein